MADVLLTAIITFLISGIGGIMLERWLSQAKPLIMINNIIFGYSKNQIADIGEDSLEIAQSIPWQLNINRRFLYVEQVDEYISNLESFVAKLDRAVKDCEKWLEDHHHESKKRKGALELNMNDVKLHPFFVHPIISQSLIGDLERFAIEPPPIDLDKIRATDSKEPCVMFDLYQQEIVDRLRRDEKNLIMVDSEVVKYTTSIDDDSISDLVLHLGSGISHIFQRSQIKTEDQRRKCTVLAESFSRCIDDNIFHYTREFISHSSSEVTRMNQLLANLKSAMRNHLTIFIELSAYNFGQSAAAISSYMGLKIFNRIRGDNTLVFKATGVRSGDLSSSGDWQGVQNMFINLNPKSSYIINLALEEDSFTIDDIKELEDIYTAGVLTCKLATKTDSRRRVVTETIGFGKKISNESYNEIKKSLQSLKC